MARELVVVGMVGPEEGEIALAGLLGWFLSVQGTGLGAIGL